VLWLGLIIAVVVALVHAFTGGGRSRV